MIQVVKVLKEVTFNEEKNVVIEIPRIPIEVDICDLWISKLEIKQNRMNEDEKIMMSKIRGMVQMKIIDDYDDDDDDDGEFDDDENDDGEEEESDVENGNENDEKSLIAVAVAVAVDVDDILLTKKVQILQKRVDKIMELSNDEILLFLTTIKSKSSTAITSSSPLSSIIVLSLIHI